MPTARAPAPGADTRVKTVFWVIVDVTAGEIAFGRGNPCAGHEPQRYSFA